MLTKQEVKLIIEEEIRNYLLEEGFLSDLGKKTSRAMLPLAMAAGISGIGSATAAPRGQLGSVETPITQTAVERASARKLAKILKDNGIKDVSPQDLATIARLTDKVYMTRAKEKVNPDTFTQSVGDFIVKVSKSHGTNSAIKLVKQYLIKKIPPKTTVTDTTFINHRLVVQNELNGIGAAAMSGGDVNTAIKKFADAVIAAYKAGDLSKEEAKEIFGTMQDNTGMSAKMTKITKILKDSK